MGSRENGLADHLWRILRGQDGQVNESGGVGAIYRLCGRKSRLHSLTEFYVDVAC
jgi:hypothetical protein